MSALFQRAALIIDQITPDHPADSVLRRALGELRHLSPAERRDISHAVFSYHRWLRWVEESGPRTAQVAAALELQRRFDADPASIKIEALAARAVPGWVLDAIDFPDAPPAPANAGVSARAAWLRSLQTPAPLWLRVQREFADKLPRALGHCEPQPPVPSASPPSSANLASFYSALRAPTAFRYTGPKDLYRTDEFKQGLFEIQDLASQLVGHACNPQPGETWWDTCCGEGGKTLHLSDLMDNRGLIWATDRHTGRLATLRKRAARAHAYNYRAVTWNGGPFLPTKTKFDGILIDAPCSGTGTWQRNPHARWTTTQDDVSELAEIQLQLLNHASPALKPGGRLIYAVCTLTRAETTAIANAFTAARTADFEPVALPFFSNAENSGEPGGARSGKTDTAHATSSATAPSQLTLWPHEHNANGMFIAAWRRRG
ncbi:RsmB/NOP family class I SAM-dependent RNA methyltransferase [Opitutaceae bacterium TAV4]|nr:RsmB/NOP family class I SAM-dependent RNA methyltransferase [Opitutaceae bacterium TAV4]RRK02446.1 RsmB/NOP family class I SAM-dependent RNA methyltransferase [Opitutaceae bacterium TAV3]